MPALTVLIPAAGASSRMRGADKLLLPIAGQPLLRHQALTALTTTCPVVVTLRPTDNARRAVLDDLPLSVIDVPDAATGLAASFRAAARLLDTALMILPADMPEIDAADLARMIAAFRARPETCHRATSANGQPGHPVILPRHLLPEIAALTGDSGARGVLAKHGAQLVPLPANHALTDLDTPEDWARWSP
jgi:molybdenum cofactor cytidylyltransferase